MIEEDKKGGAAFGKLGFEVAGTSGATTLTQTVQTFTLSPPSY
jgi:hypothetical protein